MNLLLLCISSPVYYAIYDESPSESLDSAPESSLIESAQIDEKPSTALPKIYERVRAILHEQSNTHAKKLSGIYYASGPGNLSALKLAHTFLHSWAIIESIPLYATHSFTLLPDHYIYAFGKKYFTMHSNIAPSPTKSPEQNLALITANIECVLCENPPHNLPFTPPAILPKSSFCLPCEPIYILPPV